jgi:hypothetical protein
LGYNVGSGQIEVYAEIWIEETYPYAGQVGGFPGGDDTQIQFNDGGLLSGDSAFIWDKTNNRLEIGADSVTMHSSNFGSKMTIAEEYVHSGSLNAMIKCHREILGGGTAYIGSTISAMTFDVSTKQMT